MLRLESDYVARCDLRVWQDKISGRRSLHVSMHPKEWKHVSLWYGTPMSVRCHGFEFPSLVCSCSEFYRWGSVDSAVAERTSLPFGDFEAEAEVIWEEAIPELVLDELQKDPRLRELWQRQPLPTVLNQINRVRRAKNTSVKVERQLQLIKELRSLAID
jgi:hypothetical protein